MTIDEFLIDLKEVSDQNWEIRPKTGQIRVETAVGSYCLITAVCKRKTGTRHSIADVEHAARDLGMSPDMKDTLIRVSDGESSDLDLRWKVVKALGIETQEDDVYLCRGKMSEMRSNA